MSPLDVMVPLDIVAPQLEYRILAPLILVLAGACLAMLVETTSKRGPRYGAQLIVTAATLVAALLSLARNWYIGSTVIGAVGSVAIDGPTYLVWASLLVFGLLTALLFAERKVSNGQSQFVAMGSTVPGSPTPVTGFMAICTKFAAVIALMRVFYVGLGGVRWDWQPLFALIAVLTMLVGSIVALTQTDVKRMLAYSSIAHAGFILVAVTGASTAATGLRPGGIGSVAAVSVYLVAYGFATLGAFGLVTMVRKAGGEATSLAAWQGIGRSNPVVGVLMTLFLLSFAGIPLTGGFIGKLVAFTAAWQGGYSWLVVVAILLSLVAAFIYFRMIVVMFFREPVDSDVQVASASWMTWLVVWIGAIGTLVLGVWGGPLLTLAEKASVFLR